MIHQLTGAIIFDFLDLLHQLLNEGQLIIIWGRKVKNKGNALITV